MFRNIELNRRKHQYKYRLFAISFFAINFLAVSLSIQAKDVVHAGLDRVEYHTTLLKHVLAYFPEKNYQVKGFGKDIPKQRSFILMSNNAGIDVMIGTATRERESLYLPIRFPILKGLNGWRVALINKDNPELFKDVDSLAALKKFIPGQFHSWTDTDILENNGLNVAKAGNLDGLFMMLDKNRIDYFPRSVLEADWDVRMHAELNLMVDPYLLIKYPNAYYFYVRKDNTELADDIHLGLEKALADGSFDRIFYKSYGEGLKQLTIKNRKVIHLTNAFILEHTPLEREELWEQLPALDNINY